MAGMAASGQIQIGNGGDAGSGSALATYVRYISIYYRTGVNHGVIDIHGNSTSGGLSDGTFWANRGSAAFFTDLNNYRGRTAYHSGGAFTFPTSNLHMSNFYATSPGDEWNCDCNCVCNCSG